MEIPVHIVSDTLLVDITMLKIPSFSGLFSCHFNSILPSCGKQHLQSSPDFSVLWISCTFVRIAELFFSSKRLRIWLTILLSELSETSRFSSPQFCKAIFQSRSFLKMAFLSVFPKLRFTRRHSQLVRIRGLSVHLGCKVI